MKCNLVFAALLFVAVLYLATSADAQSAQKKHKSDRRIALQGSKGRRLNRGRHLIGHHSNSGNGSVADGGGVTKQMTWLNFTEANREILQLIRRRYKNENSMLKKPKKLDKKTKRLKACHKTAMLRCGCDASSNFESQLAVSDHIPFRRKCQIREEFFRCLDDASKATCRHGHSRLIKPKAAFKQRMTAIVRMLWTTRGCILGSDDSSQSLKDLNINMRFCSALNNSSRESRHGRAKKQSQKKKKKKRAQAAAATQSS